MANEVITKYPGHKIVMNDAYVYAYKTFSPWEHTDASSFKATADEIGPSEWEWVGDKSPWHPEDIEAIATSMYAYILETVFAAIGDDENALLARKLRDHVFLNYVRSDRVQPPSENEQRPTAMTSPRSLTRFLATHPGGNAHACPVAPELPARCVMSGTRVAIVLRRQ